MTGTGTVGDPYIISSRADLETMVDDLDAYYELGADINLAGTNWVPVDMFGGHLDGKNHQITGLTTSGVTGGLFDYIWGGTVQNLAVCGYSLVGASSIGPVCGTLFAGTISGCTTSGIIRATGAAIGGIAGSTYSTCSITGCSATVDIEGLTGLGGLVGSTGSPTTISDCKAKGKIVGSFHIGGLVGALSDPGYNSPVVILLMSRCQADVDCEGKQSVGGAVGLLQYASASLLIKDCVALGDVVCVPGVYIKGLSGGFVGAITAYSAAAQLVNCYSIGEVSEVLDAGGFFGYKDPPLPEPSVVSCYWDMETSGMNHSAYGTGKTTAEMQTQSTFTDWDFTTVWNIASGLYPFLRSLISLVDGCLKKQQSNAIWYQEG
jgi:hypothetical protein